MKSFLRAAAATGVAAATLAAGLSFGPAAASAASSDAAPSTDADWYSTGSDIQLIQKIDGQYAYWDASSNVKMAGSLTEARSKATVLHSEFRSTTESGTHLYDLRDASGDCVWTWNDSGKLPEILVASQVSYCTAFAMDADGRLYAEWIRTDDHRPRYLQPGVVEANSNKHFVTKPDVLPIQNPLVDSPKNLDGLAAEVGNVDIEAGTASLSNGTTPDGATSVNIQYTNASGDKVDLNVPVTDGTWNRRLKDLPLALTNLKLTAYQDSKRLQQLDVPIDMAVSPLTALPDFASDLTEVAKITGKATPGTTVSAFHGDGNQIATTQADPETGDYQLPINPPKVGGDYEVTVAQIVRGVPQTPKQVPLQYGPGVAITFPTNGSQLDPDEDLVIRGTAQSGSPVRVYEEGIPAVQFAETEAVDDEYRLVIPRGTLEDREYKLVVAGISKGYNTTTAEITINPGKSTVQDPTAEVTFDADVTKKAVVSGEGADGATITVKNGVKTLGTVSVTDGTWALPIDPIGPGKHTLTIEQSGIEGVQTVEREVDFGDAVEISGPTGTVTPGVVSVTGTGQDGARVTVTGGAEPVTTTVEDGTFSAEIELAPSDSAKTLTAQQRSKGNLSTSDSITVTPNGAQTPQAVDITEPSSHTYKPNHETTVKGTATPYAKIELRFQWNDTVYGTAKADKNGDWSINRTFGPASTYELTATQTRVDGTTSASTRFTLAPEGLTNKEVVIAGPADHHYMPGEQTRVTGTATPYAKIELRFQWNDTVYGRATADANGNWNIIRSYGPTATYELTATQIRPDDSRSLSNTFTLAPTGVDLPFSLTTPAKESTFEPGTDVRFTGTGTRGAMVTAIAPAWNNNTIFQTKVDESGHWEIRRSFAPGITYDLTLVQQPADGDPTSITGIRLTPSS